MDTRALDLQGSGGSPQSPQRTQRPVENTSDQYRKVVRDPFMAMRPGVRSSVLRRRIMVVSNGGDTLVPRSGRETKGTAAVTQRPARYRKQ